MNIQGVGKAGSFTSFIVKKSILKKLVGGAIKNCQKHIDDQIEGNNTSWLQLQKVLQNVRGKGIATMIGKIESKTVIVKVQSASLAQHEYDIQRQLENMKGFIKYHCLFYCGGSKAYIEQFSTVGENTKVCKNKGSDIGVIIMPYYTNGSLEDVLNKIEDLEKLKSILRTIILNYSLAYRSLGYVHGDFFCKNIVLDSDNIPIIIDYEKSHFKHYRNCDIFWNDLDNLCLDMSKNKLLSQKMFDIARVFTIHRAYQQEPTEQVITDILRAIDNI